MKHTKVTVLAAAIAGAAAVSTTQAQADEFIEALTGGEAFGDFRLRYETVDQDNALKDGKALTLRSRLGYKTGDYYGFSGLLEFEDSRSIAGIDDYNDTVGNGGDYSVIADPEVTEVDQAFIQYKMEGLTAKLGRQVIAYDNQRFVGHVGWRQDRQTFNALSADYMPVKGLSLKYAYINKRNRIFAEEKDLRSKDHLLNASYATPIGKLTGYAYLLELDNDTSNSLDTYGLRLAGSMEASDLKLLYTGEYATQKSKSGSTKYDATYYFAEGGVVVAGITAKVGYEVLGSDDGMYGFSTPLATAHKFNGWTDQFLGTPAQGLKDLYASVGGKLFGGKWSVTYHDFSADEDTATIDDLGKEIDLVYSKKFGKHYNAGVKYATYSAGDKAAGKVDTDKLWLWVGLSF
ncbi:alginate export family protein [Endozoicomonas arenosclerae]|uniref:alginate export family protein n=1 Tax=Endozoicomonas arenosclerae TaxID=1633495 RepID=UPI000A96E2BC|nr:alginate export family protein [Endozoicomonas arenosclerae]